MRGGRIVVWPFSGREKQLEIELAAALEREALKKETPMREMIQPRNMAGMPGDSMLGARESFDGILSRQLEALQVKVRNCQALLKMYHTYSVVSGVTPEDLAEAERALWELLTSSSDAFKW